MMVMAAVSSSLVGIGGPAFVAVVALLGCDLAID